MSSFFIISCTVSTLTEPGRTELAPTAVARFVRKILRCIMTDDPLLQVSLSGGSKSNRFGELQTRENFKSLRNIVKVIQSKETNALDES